MVPGLFLLARVVGGAVGGIVGIIRDAWDYKSKRILCATGYVNDSLDEDMENSQWDVKDRRLHLTVKPGCHVYFPGITRGIGHYAISARYLF